MKLSENTIGTLKAALWFAVVFIGVTLSHRLIADEDAFLMVVISIAYMPLFLLLGALDDINRRSILDQELDDRSTNTATASEPSNVCDRCEGGGHQ